MIQVSLAKGEGEKKGHKDEIKGERDKNEFSGRDRGGKRKGH